MNLAESPSPSPSSSSGSEDFAAFLDSELELASAADPVTLGGASGSPTGNDDDEDLEEEDEVVVEVEALEQTRCASLHPLRFLTGTRPFGVVI